MTDSVFRRLLSTLVFFLASMATNSVVNAQESRSPAPTDKEFVVGPIDVVNHVDGVALRIPVIAFFSAEPGGGAMKVSARLFADLAELQANIGRLVDKQDLPRNNCRSYSANNPVVSVDTKRLTLSGNSAILFVGGEVVLWDCREHPVRCSKVEWDNSGPFGTPSPTVRWYDCNPPIKNKILTQPMSMTVPMTLDKASATSVRLTLGKPDVQLGGHPALSAVRDFLLDLFRVDINNIADKNLRRAIDGNKLLVSVPDDFKRLNPTVERAQFANVGGNLGVELDLSASVTAATMTDFLRLIVEGRKPK